MPSKAIWKVTEQRKQLNQIYELSLFRKRNKLFNISVMFTRINYVLLVIFNIRSIFYTRIHDRVTMIFIYIFTLLRLNLH
jgi:hypothetical protein